MPTEVGPVAGFGLHHELQEFVQDGFTPYQALETAAPDNDAIDQN